MLGEKLKQYRKYNNMTLKDLAEASGLSSGYISQLERGMVEPSLSSLRKIADVLDVPVFLLMDYEPKEILTIRNKDHMIMRNKEETVTYEFLTPLPSERFMPQSMILKFVLNPFSQISDGFLTHPSEELITIISGKMVLGIGSEEIVLCPGDSSVVKANQPHVCRNDFEEKVVGFSCITPPVWGQIMI